MFWEICFYSGSAWFRKFSGAGVPALFFGVLRIRNLGLRRISKRVGPENMRVGVSMINATFQFSFSF